MKLFSFKNFLIIFLFLFLATNVFAVFYWKPEIKYPIINIGPSETLTISTTTDIVKYIQYIFNFAILIAVIAAISSLIYGGFLYITSGDNPQQLTNAKSQIISAFLGLIIILSSHLLFTVLNPSLTNIELPKKIEEITQFNEGVKIWDNNNFQIIRVSVPDIKQLYGNFEPNRVQILDPWVGKVRVLVFSKSGYQGYSKEITTGGEYNTSFSIASIKIIPRDDGIYLAKSLTNSRLAGVYHKPYLFPDPGIEGDSFHPSWYFVAPWSFNIKLEYSTTSWPVRVKIYKNYNNGTCTGASTTIDSSKENISGYECITIESCTTTNVNNCFLEVEIYAGKEYQGLMTSNIIKGTNSNIVLKNENGEVIQFKSIKIKTKKVTPDSYFDRCPGNYITIDLHTTTTVGMFASTPGCIILKPRFPNILFNDAKLWFYKTESTFTSFFHTAKSIPDLGRTAPDFNDKIIYIKFKNKVDTNNNLITDYGAILFEDPYYRGNFKIFLSKLGKIRGNIENEGSFIMNWLFPKPPWVYTSLIFNKPNVRWGKDNWGQVRKVSSVMVFNVKNLRGESSPFCIVTLYQNPGFNGPYCKIKISSDNWTDFLEPNFIDNDKVCKNLTAQNKNNIRDLINFEDNVRSIEIDGNCIVALTELRPKDSKNSYEIEDDYPGNRSSVFLESDSDLSDNDIGKCARWRFFNAIGVAPCASGISIIPYDKDYQP